MGRPNRQLRDLNPSQVAGDLAKRLNDLIHNVERHEFKPEQWDQLWGDRRDRAEQMRRLIDQLRAVLRLEEK